MAELFLRYTYKHRCGVAVRTDAINQQLSQFAEPYLLMASRYERSQFLTDVVNDDEQVSRSCSDGFTRRAAARQLLDVRAIAAGKPLRVIDCRHLRLHVRNSSSDATLRDNQSNVLSCLGC